MDEHVLRLPRWVATTIISLVVTFIGAFVALVVAYFNLATSNIFTDVEAETLMRDIEAVRGLTITNQQLIVRGQIEADEIRQIIAALTAVNARQDEADDRQDELIDLLLRWRDAVLNRQ